MECLHQLMIHMATVATATSRVSTRVVGAVKKKTEERKKKKRVSPSTRVVWTTPDAPCDSTRRNYVTVLGKAEEGNKKRNTTTAEIVGTSGRR